MTCTLVRPICALWLAALCAMPVAAQKWQVQYFYDKAKSVFLIGDLQFPSATRGVAVGVIEEGSHQQPSSVVTSDGGAHWQTVALKETPVSLFFLNENLGWMVTTKGLWQTLEAGKSWTKLPKVPGQIYRVHFLDEKHGWAIGPKRNAQETRDGGLTWKALDTGPKPVSEDLHYSAYTWINFATPQFGVMTGWNIPPRAFTPRRPDFVDPEATLRQRETPHLSFTVSTADGGATWKQQTGSLFGAVVRLRFNSHGLGLGLLRYGESFRYPSEAYAVQWPKGGTQSVHKDPNFNVTDIWLATDGTAYLAGTKVRAQLRNRVPAPVQVLTSKDLKTWTPMPVDYRTTATGVVLASSDDEHIWMATNSGMILKLVR